MKAVILAAGIGSRLRPLTEKNPKSLINIAGKPILLHQVDAYKRAGVEEIIIVVGHYGEKIISQLKHEKNINITFVKNDVYENTNNMYSLWLARNHFSGHDFYLSNADVVFDSSILSDENSIESVIFVDKNTYNDESMKVSVNAEGKIIHISKKIEQDKSYAASIDVYRFTSSDGQKIAKHVGHIIEKEKRVKEWTEVALDEMFEKGIINPKPIDIKGKNWVEVDNYNDLSNADKKFSNFDLTLNSYDNFVFDLDGTLFIGNQPIKSAINEITKISKMGKNIYYMTNNSSKSKKQYVEKLQKAGLHVSQEQIISSIDNTIFFLKKNKINEIYTLGTDSLIDTLEKEGINAKSENPELIIVGYDTELNYNKLQIACKHINQGINFIATHSDIFCPSPWGNLPDCGALVSMLEITTNKKCMHVFGKPNPDMFNGIDLDMERTVIVGDRLHTDGKLANNVGAKYILVLSGETSRDMIDGLTNINIDLCLQDFGQLDVK